MKQAVKLSGDLRVEYRAVADLSCYEKNARTHSDAQVRQVAVSIKEFGWTNPVLIGNDNVLIAGHARLLAARKLGMKEVPVIVLGHLSAAQRRALVLTDNKLALNAGWDEDMLRVELAELQNLDFDLGLTGFDVHELDALLRDPRDEEQAEEAPPLPAVATSRTGDLWQLGPHRLLCGDATSAEAVTRLLAEHKPQLLTTDPPYGISLDSEWRDRAGLNKNGPAQASYMKHRTEGHTNTSISSDTRADWSEAFELVPSLQVAFVWHASVYRREVLDGLVRIGFLYPQQIIWNKGRTVLTRTHYWYQHEPAWYVRKKNAPWFGKAGENSTIWDCPSPKFILGSSKEEKYDHPTQKPLDIMRRPILNHTKRGESVYDAFLGSGTTLMAAELTDRICLGMELDPKYVDVIIQRWEGFTGKKAVLDGSGLSFAEIAVERTNASV